MATPAQIAKKLESILTNVPDLFRKGKNFKALFATIAASDADLENLFIEVKRQLFINTADGQYLDMLGANVGVVRPPLVGMVDQDFRDFIKLQTYYPKQIRQLLYRLMELFYGRDTIKANIRSVATGPYQVFDNANLLIRVDGQTDIEVVFKAANFNDPNHVSAAEIAAQINTQVQGGVFAATYYNAIDKQEFVEVYTDTYGPVGSIEIRGGSANRFLKFPETLRYGTTIASRYRIVKNSTTIDLYWAGGDNPLFSQLNPGDSVILTGPSFLPGNVGSFVITEIVDTGYPAYTLNATSALITTPNVVRITTTSPTTGVVIGKDVIVAGFTNASNNGIFQVNGFGPNYIDVVSPRVNSNDDETNPATVDLLPNAARISFASDLGVDQPEFGVTSVDDVLFFRPKKNKLESAKRPATVWEINSNEIVVTLPATPVVVRRGLAGSAHMQGTSAVVERAFTSSVTVTNPQSFPLTQGRFFLQQPDGFIDFTTPYTYSVNSTGQLLNVLPQVKPAGDKLILGIGPLAATSGSNVIRVTTIEPHGLVSGELIRLANWDGFAGLTADQINGSRSVVSIIDPVTFTVNVGGTAAVTTTNAPTVDKGEIFTTHNMKVEITNVQQNGGYVGSFVYDEKNAKYTIAQTQTNLEQDIALGQFGDSIQVHDSSVFSSNTGQVVIGYGRADEEGPISYIAKPSSSTLFIDPSYRYKKSHAPGAAINLVGSLFATSVASNGKQYPVYVVDTIGPREKLKDLLLDAKAAGISVRFIVILPDNVYNAFSLYETQS